MAKTLLERRWPWLVAAGVIILVFLSTFIQIRLPGPSDPRPLGSADDIAALRERTDVNVLFVLIDMLRADRLGAYGAHRDTSPSLDRLAASGVRFANQLSQSSWTKSSMASLWTALYPARNGVTRYNHVLPDAAELAPEVLAKAGFRTVGIYRNGWVAPTFGFAQGYEVYKRPAAKPLSPSVKQANPTLTDQSTDAATIEAALEFLRIEGHERWFLYLHLMDVHEYLYDSDSALFGSSHSDIYDNAIRHVDSLIGWLVDELDARGYRDKTLIVVTADHGEAFGERGFDGHAREVFRETTEVPLIISFPFRLEPGIVVNARTRNVDVWPTVLDLFGLSLSGDIDGRSRRPELLALARGEQPDADGAQAIAHLDQSWGRPDLPPQPTVAVVDGDYRYVRMQGSSGGPAEKLLDRRGDPEEMVDRAAQDPATLERLRQAADRYFEQRPSWGETPTRQLDELELNQLRALGYAIP